MKLLAGTSGYAFKEWKGAFYPKELKDGGMLGFYASKFPAVEINNTFYRLPKENVLREWAAQVPETFTFAVKASQRITHHARLKEQAADTVDFLLKNTAVLGDRLGPILFQLPPNLKKDTNRFRGFLGLLPSDRRYVFEFRHESWFDDEIYDAMRERDIAMCVIEQDEFKCPVVSTASWGYLRLHKLDYDNAALTEWANCVTNQRWKEAYVFFKHDESEAGGSGPPAVSTFVTACESLATQTEVSSG
ncbi:MAG TPA: DUF72 domain-containing protein [Gemmatimonadaceae bacterium]|nr:DUF72 domain-containing protein [Gemmatimonadaceae bacterium]